MATKIIKRSRRKIITPKDCMFCKENKDISFLDTETLRRFLTERGKIISRVRTGLCSKHQRHLTIAIKRARHLAFLPFTGRY